MNNTHANNGSYYYYGQFTDKNGVKLKRGQSFDNIRIGEYLYFTATVHQAVSAHEALARCSNGAYKEVAIKTDSTLLYKDKRLSGNFVFTGTYSFTTAQEGSPQTVALFVPIEEYIKNPDVFIIQGE